MHRYFCTYFDSNYLVYAKILSESLNIYQPKHTLFIVCMDDKVFKELNSNPLPNSIVFAHKKLIEFRPSLIKIKQQRSLAEYFFTCSAQVCEFILNENPNIDLLNYIDTDLCFFSSPEPIFNELDGASVGIIPHRFHWTSKSKIKYGKFNVGWISFRNDIEGNKCVSEWAKNCMEWCFQRLEKGKYADQKYLNYWPDKYNNLKILNHKGANLAVWNVKNYSIKMKEGKIFIDDQPLIFYHFAGLKQFSKSMFKTNLGTYFVTLDGILRENIYMPYIKKILGFQSQTVVSFIKESYQNKLLHLAKKVLNKFRTIVYKDTIEIKTI